MSVPYRELALVLIASVLLAACGSGGPTPTQAPATAAVAPTALPTPAPPTQTPVKATDTVPPAATEPPAAAPGARVSQRAVLHDCAAAKNVDAGLGTAFEQRARDPNARRSEGVLYEDAGVADVVQPQPVEHRGPL